MDLGKMQKAQSLLDEGIALIDKQQKIIKIADKLKGGGGPPASL